jgi:hypothetical protein
MSNGVNTTYVDATPAQIAEAQRLVKLIRENIKKFHDVRRRNNERAAGMRPAMVHPLQVRQVIAQQRDAKAEQQAVESLKNLISIIVGGEPTKEQVQAGIPDNLEGQLGMGLWPAIILTGLVAVAVPTSAIFVYLTEREVTVQTLTATPFERVLNALSDNIYAVALLGAIGGGVAIYFASTSSRRAMEREAAEYHTELTRDARRGLQSAEKSREKALKGPNTRGKSDPYKRIERRPESLNRNPTPWYEKVKNAIFPQKNPVEYSVSHVEAIIGDLPEEEKEELIDRLLDAEDAEEGEEEGEGEGEGEEEVAEDEEEPEEKQESETSHRHDEASRGTMSPKEQDKPSGDAKKVANPGRYTHKAKGGSKLARIKKN